MSNKDLVIKRKAINYQRIKIVLSFAKQVLEVTTVSFIIRSYNFFYIYISLSGCKTIDRQQKHDKREMLRDRFIRECRTY